eukprot:7169949-Prymnesium_polylepis.1
MTRFGFRIFWVNFAVEPCGCLAAAGVPASVGHLVSGTCLSGTVGHCRALSSVGHYRALSG